VILEMGYFLAKLGRKNVFVLVEEGIEIPSDYSRVPYTPFKADGSWKGKLARECPEPWCGMFIIALIEWTFAVIEHLTCG
jgi:predicted nucleotide-binding protein